MGKLKKNEKDPKQSNISKRSGSTKTTKEALDVQSKQLNNAHRSAGNKIES